MIFLLSDFCFTGAALGPLFTGFILPYGWQKVFWMLIGSNILALLVSIDNIFRY